VAERGGHPFHVVKPNPTLAASRVAPIYAIPGDPSPFTYVVAGTQLRVDCVRELEDKYSFGHISSAEEKNRWIDIHDLLLPNGDQPFKALAEVPELDICK
jgi:hypothetical protein